MMTHQLNNATTVWPPVTAYASCYHVFIQDWPNDTEYCAKCGAPRRLYHIIYRTDSNG